MTDFILISPELCVLVMTCLVLLADLFLPQQRYHLTYLLTQLTLVSGLVLTLGLYTQADALAFNNLFIHDHFGGVLKIAIYLTSMLVFSLSRDYLIEHNLPREFYLLGLFSIIGMLIAVSSQHFLSLYLGLELMSLPIYAMVALARDSVKATEAAIKYFVLGVLSSGMLLYGLSMLYGVTHSLDMHAVSVAVAVLPSPPLLMVGLVLVVTGLAFKLGAVPFHMWVPDVYEGAPLAATLFITVAPKLAAFGISYRLLVDAMPHLQIHWQALLIILAVLSMVLGNIAAIIQNNIRRMLAYSTIAHAGYMLLGLCAATPMGFAASLYYAIVYSVTSIGGFGLLTLLSKRGLEINDIDDLRGLNARNPGLAMVLLIVLFSMAGFPPTVGFFADLGVFQALIYAPQNLIWLACLAMVLAVIGSYYYLRVIKVMYFDAPACAQSIVLSTNSRYSINVTGLAVLMLGIFPSSLIEITRLAIIS